MFSIIGGLFRRLKGGSASPEEVEEENTSKDHSTPFLRLANGGNAIAQYGPYMMYEQGLGVSKNPQIALQWLKRAAENDYVPALSELATRYASGDKGVEQNDERSVALYAKAARQGDAFAQRSLGLMRQYGRGCRQDSKKAFALYEMAADQGDPIAQNMLGVMYNNGIGVDRSEVMAAMWLGKSATQKYKDAQFNLACMYADGKGVDQDYSMAAFWFQLAAGQGDVLAQFNLGVMYSTGLGVEANRQEAMDWYLKAAAQGHMGAIFNLSDIFIQGKVVTAALRTPQTEVQMTLATENA